MLLNDPFFSSKSSLENSSVQMFIQKLLKSLLSGGPQEARFFQIYTAVILSPASVRWSRTVFFDLSPITLFS